MTQLGRYLTKKEKEYFALRKKILKNIAVSKTGQKSSNPASRKKN